MRTLSVCSRALAIALVLGSPAVAGAQGRSFALNRFEPSERGSTWFAADSLDLRGRARVATGVVTDYQYRPLAIYAADDTLRAAVVRHVLTIHPGVSVVLLDRLRFGASLPVALYQDGETGVARGVTYLPPANAQHLGDLRFAVDARLVGKADDPFTLALGARAWASTGGTKNYLSDGVLRFGPQILAAGTSGLLAYAARVGVTVRDPDANVGDTRPGSELVYAGAVGVRVWDARVQIGPEVFGGTFFSNAFATRASPLEVLLGAHAALPANLRASAGIGTSLVSGLGAPGTRALFGLEWAQPAEARVVRADPCAAEADVPLAQRSVACGGSPPVDTDADGIVDREDACLDVPGARTGDPRTNGCADSDGDGLLDPLDRCPTEPGASEDPKRAGCPPEVVPVVDPDPDHDGVPADVDACPDEPGPPDKNPRRNGCPRARMRGDELVLAEPVLFAGDTATIVDAEDGHQILEAVLAVLSTRPEITKLRVEGHSDNRGSARVQKKVSLERANAVVAWLVEHGVERERLLAVGLGAERPIDSNDTEEGRAVNRRIELHIETREDGSSVGPSPEK